MKSKTYVSTVTYRDNGVYQSFTLEVATKNKIQARTIAYSHALFEKSIGIRSIYSVSAFKHKAIR
ncbi:hypothetical protein ACS76D_11650 [Listeria monocytogenes]|uniref:hypothetical protein n=1 Tax=Listeria monocytogenes TaxID=1639 RepID=UPI0017697EF3|nr:hypothetical protein [Listeria monocytogenes]EGP9299648.1 hypothetical protein [Listeria monocytogenes]EGP9638154.1 hypothetical protein [Listeria monocytogenes]EGP9788458.1 hypothetical protein [Listeria monocytogenes]EGQ0006118.1 hypothetical protein [Listeria monocytogenes]